jgi:hypothetical protein
LGSFGNDVAALFSGAMAPMAMMLQPCKHWYGAAAAAAAATAAAAVLGSCVAV